MLCTEPQFTGRSSEPCSGVASLAPRHHGAGTRRHLEFALGSARLHSGSWSIISCTLMRTRTNATEPHTRLLNLRINCSCLSLSQDRSTLQARLWGLWSEPSHQRCQGEPSRRQVYHMLRHVAAIHRMRPKVLRRVQETYGRRM